MSRQAAAFTFALDARQAWNPGDKVKIKAHCRETYRRQHFVGNDGEGGRHDFADSVLTVSANGPILQLGMCIGARKLLRVGTDDVEELAFDVPVGSKIS